MLAMFGAKTMTLLLALIGLETPLGARGRAPFIKLVQFLVLLGTQWASAEEPLDGD